MNGPSMAPDVPSTSSSVDEIVALWGRWFPPFDHWFVARPRLAGFIAHAIAACDALRDDPDTQVIRALFANIARIPPPYPVDWQHPANPAMLALLRRHVHVMSEHGRAEVDRLAQEFAQAKPLPRRKPKAPSPFDLPQLLQDEGVLGVPFADVAIVLDQNHDAREFCLALRRLDPRLDANLGYNGESAMLTLHPRVAREHGIPLRRILYLPGFIGFWHWACDDFSSLTSRFPIRRISLSEPGYSDDGQPLLPEDS